MTAQARTQALSLSLAAGPRLREVSALCLVWGLLRAAEDVPQDALEGILEALVAAEDDRNAPSA